MEHAANGAPLGAAARWLARQGRWRCLVVAMLAGAAMTLGQPPIALPWALFLALPVLVWLIDAAPGPEAVGPTQARGCEETPGPL